MKQVHALMGGINRYGILPNLSKRLRPVNSLLRKGVNFLSTPAMEKLVREILAELVTPSILVFPNWGAIADGSRPFHVYSDACIDGFGVALEQEQSDYSMKPIAYISRATLDWERHWTPLDVEACSIVWAVKPGYVWRTKVRILSDHKALESIGKVGNHNARVQRLLEFLTAFDYTVEYRKGSANGNADFLSRLPEPATKHDYSGSTSLTPVEDGGIHLIRARGLRTPSSLIPGVGLGGLLPTESTALGGLHFTSADFRDYRTHGPRTRIDELSAPSERFVARVSASVATADLCPGRGRILRAADTAFASFFFCTHRGRHGHRSRPCCCDDRRPVDSFFKEFYTGDRLRRGHRPDRVRPCLTWHSSTSDGEAAFGPHLHSDAPTNSNRSRHCTPCCGLWLRARRGRSNICPVSDRDRTEPAGTPLLRLPPPPGDMPTASTKLDALIPSRVIRMPTGGKNSRLSRHAMPQCAKSLSAGRRPCHPTFCPATPHASVLPCRASRNWLVKDDYTQPTTTSSYSSLIRRRHRRRRRLTLLARWGERLAC